MLKRINKNDEQMMYLKQLVDDLRKNDPVNFFPEHQAGPKSLNHGSIFHRNSMVSQSLDQEQKSSQDI